LQAFFHQNQSLFETLLILSYTLDFLGQIPLFYKREPSRLSTGIPHHRDHRGKKDTFFPLLTILDTINKVAVALLMTLQPAPQETALVLNYPV